jgi:hypothetical protein
MSRLALYLAAILYAIAAIGPGVNPPMRVVLTAYCVANVALAWNI